MLGCLAVLARQVTLRKDDSGAWCVGTAEGWAPFNPHAGHWAAFGVEINFYSAEIVGGE